MKYIMYCDGATKGSNPSLKTGVGVICYSENPKREIFRIAKGTGPGTNNYAEYMSVIIGLETAIYNNIENLWICMDSQLVVRQCKKEWKVKEPSLQPLNAKVLELVKQMKSVSFYWVSRNENTEADKLSKQGLEE
jgi:ribonuclease HI